MPKSTSTRRSRGLIDASLLPILLAVLGVITSIGALYLAINDRFDHRELEKRLADQQAQIDALKKQAEGPRTGATFDPAEAISKAGAKAAEQPIDGKPPERLGDRGSTPGSKLIDDEIKRASDPTRDVREK